MTICILYICTGRYAQFFEGFFQSCEQYLLRGKAEIHYHVFTDRMDLSSHPRVHLHAHECQGFPLDSLFRFDMFLSIRDELKAYDYLYFFNANMLFVAPVGEEILPDETGLLAVRSPGYDRRPASLFPYERDKRSLAYMPPHMPGRYIYYMGGLNGGTPDRYLALCETLSRNTHDDYERGIIASVHDESHLNRYLSLHPSRVLDTAYGYPEGWRLPYTPKIIIRDKVRLDPYFNKGLDHSLRGKARKALHMAIRALRWYF